MIIDGLSDKVWELQAQQGWNDETLLLLLSHFIGDRVSLCGELEEWLVEVAREENGEAVKCGMG